MQSSTQMCCLSKDVAALLLTVLMSVHTKNAISVLGATAFISLLCAALAPLCVLVGCATEVWSTFQHMLRGRVWTITGCSYKCAGEWQVNRAMLTLAIHHFVCGLLYKKYTVHAVSCLLRNERHFLRLLSMPNPCKLRKLSTSSNSVHYVYIHMC